MKFFVSTSKDEKEAVGSTLIPLQIELSRSNRARGQTLTVIGRGFKDGTTATVWLDTNRDGTRDAGEIDLASVIVAIDDTFEAVITVQSPPFTTIVTTNSINAVDGRANKIDGGINDEGLSTIPRLGLSGIVTAKPANVSIGKTTTLLLQDFDASVSVTDTAVIRLGGVNVVIPADTVTDANGEVAFEITIPNGVPPGQQSLEISGICCALGGGSVSTRRTTLTVN